MKLKILLATVIFALSYFANAQKSKVDQYPDVHFDEWEIMNQSKNSAIEWFKDAKFGMFIHWGLYSIPAGVWRGTRIHDMRSPHVAEWIMYSSKISRADYAELAQQFNPTQFSAEEIVRLAKDAGMKYIVITTKHHEGFALFDSKVSEFDIMDASPFKRDIIHELSVACKKFNMAFGVYYSHNIDWMDGSDAQSALSAQINPTISEKEKTFGANTWDPSQNSFDDYLKTKALPQVKELMQNYPDIKMIWYDMPHRMNAEQSFEFYKTAYKYQPKAIICDRVGNGFGDYTIPGDNTIPKDDVKLLKPWETVGTFNNSWGYNSYDNDWKSPKEVLYWLIEIVSKGGNYMLNIGPTREGVVPIESVNSLKSIGKWLSVNGEAVYGTTNWKISREGPTNINFKSTEDRAQKGFNINFTPQDFWFTTKDDFVYAISIEKPIEIIKVKSFNSSVGEISKVNVLGIGKVKFKQTEKELIITIPKEFRPANGFVVRVKLNSR